MLSLAVIAYQVVIGSIIIAAALLGGKTAFFIVVALCIVWTIVNVYLSPLLVIQFGTIALASWFAYSNIPSAQHSELTNLRNHHLQVKENKSSTKVRLSQPQKRFHQEQDSTVQHSSKSTKLIIGHKYPPEKVDEYFRFDYKPPAGIKYSDNGDIVLFINTNNSKYHNIKRGNVILFQGQNTGKGDQRLIYGNKKLYDAYGDPNVKVHLFKNLIYMGEYVISEKPFLKNRKWFFPITPSKGDLDIK